MNNIVFLWGLPGSGKTSYADELENNKDVRVIDLDRICRHYKEKDLILKGLADEVICASSPLNRSIIIDGLVTTNNQLREIIDHITKWFKTWDYFTYEYSFSIVYWEEDRENCLLNDIGRREVPSAISIKHMKFEKPDLSILKEVNDVKVMEVYKQSPAEKWVKSLKINYDVPWSMMELRSDDWSLGGTWGNCWGDSGTKDAELPLEFIELDNLLLNVCPNISFFLVKKIKEECCNIETTNNHDYYGGYTQSAYHCCDLNKLYFILNKNKLI